MRISVKLIFVKRKSDKSGTLSQADLQFGIESTE
jgi:hypothetical protein